MTRALKERVDSREARREPPYRSTMELTPEQQKTLGEKLGGIQNYNPVVLREMARKDRRLFAPLIMAILSAEFRGIALFGRFVRDTEREGPWHMKLGFT